MVLILLASRNMLSWSFDRVFPAAFSKVNARFHTPHWSILFVYLVSLVYLVMVLQYPYLLAVNVCALATLRYVFSCWACMVLPYYRPELW
jgi:amino acid transporter